VRTLRKLVLGETWTLPLGIAAAVALAVVVRLAAGDDGWFGRAGGWLLFAALAVVLVVSLVRPGRR
jgi:cyanate permease